MCLSPGEEAAVAAVLVAGWLVTDSGAGVVAVETSIRMRERTATEGRSKRAGWMSQDPLTTSVRLLGFAV